jgi:hypothetical protein
MNCVKTSDSVLDISAKDSTQNQDDTTDWYADFKSGTEFAENEAAKVSPQSSAQLVHDICTKDVRDFGMASRTIYAAVPCNPDGSSGCRGGLLPSVVPSVANIRILCADERLSPSTDCNRIVNTVEFEVVLQYGDNTFVVLTPKETFDILWSDFKRFPSFQSFSSANEFRQELKKIDGSCKAIKIVSATVQRNGNDCVLKIDYKVFDKLWKFEDLIILAVKPISDNTTVCDLFNQGHNIGPCSNGSGSTCCGG